MNAGNVSSMRFVADLLDKRGRGQQAAQLRSRGLCSGAAHQSDLLRKRQGMVAMRAARRFIQ